MTPLRRLALASLVLAPLSWYAFADTQAGGAGAFVFELELSGKSWQTGVILNPGVKPPIGKITNKNIADVLKGTLPDYAADFVDLDPGGKFYLHYDGKDQWRIGTNPQGADTTTLTGQVANDGVFWMAGSYDMFMAGADVFVTGKVTFANGTFNPKKIKGKFYLVSEAISTGLNLKFETVGKAL